MLYPVCFAPTGMTPDLRKVEFAEGVLPAGWMLATTVNNVYLTDGKVTAYSETQSGSTRTWSGAGADGDYFNTENWINGSIPDISCIAQFKGLLNTGVLVSKNLTLREFKLFKDCGPFVFGGSPITFQYPGITIDGGYASVRNDGKFSISVANVVGAVNLLRVLALDEGSVALTGAGKVELAVAGMKIRKVTCADGAKIFAADDLVTTKGFTAILTVREPDDSIAFDDGLKFKVRYDLLTDQTTYSAKRKSGVLLIIR